MSVSVSVSVSVSLSACVTSRCAVETDERIGLVFDKVASIVEMKRLRKNLRVSWTAKKTNEWVLNKAGVKRELLDTVKARKLAYYGRTMRKQRSCLEKEIMQGTMPGARRRGRPRTA